MIPPLTSLMMLRRDSSSLTPRDNVRFLGEPLLSRVTECMVLFLFLSVVFCMNLAFM